MSIMIKGIKFPDVGVRDVVIAFANHCLLITDECGKELFYGEYVEIPTPHGRLIDDFKLLRALIKAFPNQSMNFYDTLERVIDEAPTIIEAEVSE